MKNLRLSLFKTVNYLGELPGGSSVRVYYSPVCMEFIISKTGKDITGDFVLICAGDPFKFFIYLKSLITKDILQK